MVEQTVHTRENNPMGEIRVSACLEQSGDSEGKHTTEQGKAGTWSRLHPERSQARLAAVAMIKN